MTVEQQICLVGFTYREWPLKRLFEAARAYGFPWVEIRACADADVHTVGSAIDLLDRAESLARRYGTRLGVISLGSLVVGRLEDLATRNPVVFDDRTLARAQSAGIELVHLLVERVRPDGTHVLGSDEASEEDFAICRRALELLGARLAQYGLKAAVEVRAGTISDTLAGSLWSVPLEHDAVGVLLDFANLTVADPTLDLVDAVRTLGDRIRYVHLKNVKLSAGTIDADVPLAYGVIDTYRVLHELDTLGYSGLLGLEYLGRGDADVFVRDDAEYLRWLGQRLQQR